MEGRHDRNAEVPCRIGRHEAKRRGERAVDVEDVDTLLAENAPQGSFEAQADRDPRKGAVAEEDSTPSDAVNPWCIVSMPVHTRCDHHRPVS